MNFISQLLITVFVIPFTESQVDTTGCSYTPLTCFDPARARNLCNSDADCPAGKTCCYKSCYKKCVQKSPCSNVVCRSGYLCQVVSTPCMAMTCKQEASCLPANQVNCPGQINQPPCPPGYERTKDFYGCRSGPCQAKRLCAPSCRILCPYGQALDDKDCPICQCKPAPQNPCSTLGCSGTQECRFLSSPSTNTGIPATLQPGCIPNNFIPSVIDKSCSLKNPTTTGLPILDNRAREIDCAATPCPSHSVCVTIASNMHRCCWQHSQLAVMTGPKVGECPPSPMLRYGVAVEMCEVDANCPGTFKCCYVNRSRGRSMYVGICLPPIHVTLSQRNLCNPGDERLWFFMALGVC